jgi:hypothetical protein
MSKAAIQSLHKAIEEQETETAVSILEKGFYAENCFFSQIRKEGLFRASRYEYDSAVLKKVITSFCQKIPKEDLPLNEANYLESVLALFSVSHSVNSIYKGFKKNLSNKDLKSYLVSIEQLFWNPYIKTQITINNHYSQFTKEELAEAFSFYYFHLTQKFSENNIVLGLIDTKKVKSGYYLQILAELSKINHYRQCEILVDNFDYCATRVKSKIILEPKDELLEKSIRLGYIHYDMQALSDYQRFSDFSAQSLKSLSKAFIADFMDRIFEIKEVPVKRIVMQFPMIDEFRDMIVGDSLFKEEYADVLKYGKELFVTKEQIEFVQIHGNITLIDVIKFQRFIRLLYWAYEKFIEEKGLKNSSLFIQSIIPVFKRETFLESLEFIFGPDKYIDLFELLSWKESSNSVFDLQTSPLLRIDKWIVYPLALIAQTNLVRNLLQKTRFRYDATSDIDPVVNVLTKDLEPHSKTIKTNLSYRWKKHQGDLDTVAVIDDILFVFECKNSLHPCNIFELRTSYDYIKKGSKQLRKFMDLFGNLEFREYFGKRINYENVSELKLVPCIVMGNRLFSGWKEKGCCVRPIHELCNVISSGEIVVNQLDSQGKSINLGYFKLWEGNCFSGRDLEKYIMSDSLHKPQFESMESVEGGVKIRSKTIIQKTFALDIMSLHQMYSGVYSFIPEEEIN